MTSLSHFQIILLGDTRNFYQIGICITYLELNNSDEIYQKLYTDDPATYL